MKDTYRRLIIALLWSTVALCLAGFGFGPDISDADKAWVFFGFVGSGWIVHKVINWVMRHKEISRD